MKAVLFALNAKYIHSSLAPWCLLAGVEAAGPAGVCAEVREGTVNEPERDVLARILARICPKRTYTQKEFVEHIATFQHLPKNVIGAALDACIDELCDLLANGNIVELGELGFFSTSLKCL